MKRHLHHPCYLSLGLALSLSLFRASPGEPRDALDDPVSARAQPAVPVAVRARLNQRQRDAALQGRLGWQAAQSAGARPPVVPVQWEFPPGEVEARATWLMPSGLATTAKGAWRAVRTRFEVRMQAVQEPASGQVQFAEASQPVLRYNYRTVEPGDVLREVTEGNRIYARPRSDYIHPLYGLDGEVLTRDWSHDHPHHRGIYWAWPEVEYGKERGDLHALQRVFARPTGNLKLESGPVFAQVEAENLWLWEDREPIVREQAVIRSYRATPAGRVVDLRFRFEGLKDGVTIARRDTSHYGGLNLRLATPQSQEITTQTDAAGAVPRRAWSDLSGLFAGTKSSGLTVLQWAQNPEYPGDWIQYPPLSWCQPAFPSAGTRYALPRGESLELRFRLWVHSGSKPDPVLAAGLWDNWHAPQSAPLP